MTSTVSHTFCVTSISLDKAITVVAILNSLCYFRIKTYLVGCEWEVPT